MALNPRQQLFVKEYLVDKNASRAAKAAGYSPKTAPFIGAENLKKPQIKAAIAAGLQKQFEKIEKKALDYSITKERVLERLAQIAFANLRDYVVVSERGGVKLLPTSTREPVQDVAIKKISQTSSQHGGSQSLELHDPKGALELISRMCGWIVNKNEITGKDGEALQISVEILDGHSKNSSE